MKTQQSQVDKYKIIVNEIISGIQDGLSEKESVTLAKITWDEYLILKKRMPEFASLVERERIKFKRSFLAQMKNLAAEGNIKALDWVVANAGAFVETQESSQSSDPLREALAQIRSSSTSPVKAKTI